MADFTASSWKEDDDLNTALAPNGMPAGTQAGSLYGIVRNLMGASVRNARMNSPYYTTTGSANTYVLTFDKFNGPDTKQVITFKVHVTNTGASTLNINSTGAKPIVGYTGAALAANNLVTGQTVSVVYDGTSYKLATPYANALNANTFATVSNKSFDDATTYIVDNADVTKRLNFDVSPITSSVTRTFAVPDNNGTLVLHDNPQTLSNKSLTDISTYFVDNGTPSKRMSFELSGVSASTTRTLSVPDAKGTLVLETAGQTLTNKTISGGTISGTIAGTPTYTGLQTVAINTSSTIQEYLQLRPTDFGAGKPYLTFQKLGTASHWAIGLYDGTNNAGLINISATEVRANNVQVADISTVQTLSNKALASTTTTLVGTDTTKKLAFDVSAISTATTRTLSAPNLNGVIATTNNAQTFTGVQTFSSGITAGSSTINGSLVLTPAGNASIELGRIDGVSSTPFIDFHSGTTATDYDARIIASGGTGTAGGGSINVDAAVFNWGGNSLVSTNSGTQTIAGTKTFSSAPVVSVATAVTAATHFRAQPTDYGAGKPAFAIIKNNTANQWDLNIYDGVNNNGTVNVVAQNLTHNGQAIYDRANILGTVGQSGGVPTGAIIESSAPTAHMYYRLADGTQVCYGYRTLSYATTTRIDNTITFAASFIDTAYSCTLLVRPATKTNAISTIASTATPGIREMTAPVSGGYTATGCTAAIYTFQGAPAFASGDSMVVEYIATGRWY